MALLTTAAFRLQGTWVEIPLLRLGNSKIFLANYALVCYTRLPKAAQGYMRLKTGLHNSKLRAHMHYLKLRAHLHNSKLRAHMQNSKLRDNTPLILIFLSLYSVWLFVHFGIPYITFNTNSTRSGSHLKLFHPRTVSVAHHHFRIVRLWDNL